MLSGSETGLVNFYLPNDPQVGCFGELLSARAGLQSSEVNTHLRVWCSKIGRPRVILGVWISKVQALYWPRFSIHSHIRHSFCMFLLFPRSLSGIHHKPIRLAEQRKKIFRNSITVKIMSAMSQCKIIWHTSGIYVWQPVVPYIYIYIYIYRKTNLFLSKWFIYTNLFLWSIVICMHGLTWLIYK